MGISLNKPDGVSGTLSRTQVVWTFNGPIIGVMSNSTGTHEAASTFEIGAPGANYTVGPPGQAAPYPARGMEGGDSYTVAGNQITVSMIVTQPGDWIRVITRVIIEVDIDIKPDSFPNSIDPKAGGFIPVAILTTPEFDALTVDHTTVTLRALQKPMLKKTAQFNAMRRMSTAMEISTCSSTSASRIRTWTAPPWKEP